MSIVVIVVVVVRVIIALVLLLLLSLLIIGQSAFTLWVVVVGEFVIIAGAGL